MGARRRVAILATMFAIAIGAPVHARRAPKIAAPARLRLEGYAGAAPAGVVSEAHLVLQHQGKDYPFDLTKMVVITGDRSYSQVLQEITPYRVSFFLRGSSPAVRTLIDAPAGQKLIVSGYHRAGSRDLMIDSVEPVPPETPIAPVP